LSDLFAALASAAGAELEHALDAASEADRIDAVRAMSRDQQKRLWSVTSANPRPDGELIRSDAADGTERFAGRNTLGFLSRFEKRFFRSGAGVFGMNQHALMPLIGPGYFGVARRTSGGLVFGYRNLPASAPAGWPSVRSNDRGLARGVYGALVDEVVWVSRDVLIGAAYRDGRPLDSYFVLARMGSVQG
jgi:hypothetical protein